MRILADVACETTVDSHAPLAVADDVTVVSALVVVDAPAVVSSGSGIVVTVVVVGEFGAETVTTRFGLESAIISLILCTRSLVKEVQRTKCRAT